MISELLVSLNGNFAFQTRFVRITLSLSTYVLIRRMAFHQAELLYNLQLSKLCPIKLAPIRGRVVIGERNSSSFY